MPDFYPTNMGDKAAWHANFAANIGGLAAKYNLTAGQLTQIAGDNDWMQFWVSLRFSAATFASQLAAYFNVIAGPDNSLDPPAVPTFELTSSDPPSPEPLPGIEYRVREIARHIKGHSSYSEADGTLLGIIGESSGAVGVSQPEIQAFAANSGYEFSIVVSKRGTADSWQVWATIAGENKWNLLATATGKSANVVYTPLDQDNPVPYQLQVRVQLRRNNQDYGDTSLMAPVTVSP